MFSSLAIIGVGLIGGSVGLAARKHHVADRIVGIGRHEQSLAKAKSLGVIDTFSTDLAAAVANIDLVIVCTPVEMIAEQVRNVALHAAPGTLITDCGSTKAALVKQIESDLRKSKSQVDFVGSHPMAGSEKTGVEHARADLFENRAVIITPTKKTKPEALARITDFWLALGAKVLLFSPAEHDALVASASHVPHVISAALAAATPQECLPLVAGGWLDTTRVAAGDVELWRQILSQNRSHVLKGLARFEKVLHALRAALEHENDAKLVQLLEAGKRTRDSVGN